MLMSHLEQGFDCNDPLGHFHIRTDYYNYFKKWYPSGPQFTPEFQGGAFDREFIYIILTLPRELWLIADCLEAWGGPGYEKCAEMVG